MPLDISGELEDDDVARTLQTAELCEQAAIADELFHASEQEKKLSNGPRFTIDVQSGYLLLDCERSSVLSEPQVNTNPFGKLSSVDFRAIGGLPHGATMDVADDIQPMRP